MLLWTTRLPAVLAWLVDVTFFSQHQLVEERPLPIFLSLLGLVLRTVLSGKHHSTFCVKSGSLETECLILPGLSLTIERIQGQSLACGFPSWKGPYQHSWPTEIPKKPCLSFLQWLVTSHIGLGESQNVAGAQLSMMRGKCPLGKPQEVPGPRDRKCCFGLHRLQRTKTFDLSSPELFAHATLCSGQTQALTDRQTDRQGMEVAAPHIWNSLFSEKVILRSLPPHFAIQSLVMTPYAPVSTDRVLDKISYQRLKRKSPKSWNWKQGSNIVFLSLTMNLDHRVGWDWLE